MDLIKNARLHAQEIPRLFNSISNYYSESKISFDRVQHAFLNKKNLAEAFNIAQSEMDEAYQGSIQELNTAMTWMEQELAEEKKFIGQLEGIIKAKKNLVETIPEETQKAIDFPEHDRNKFFYKLKQLYYQLMAIDNHLKEREPKRFKSIEVIDNIINNMDWINNSLLFLSLLKSGDILIDFGMVSGLDNNGGLKSGFYNET